MSIPARRDYTLIFDFLKLTCARVYYNLDVRSIPAGVYCRIVMEKQPIYNCRLVPSTGSGQALGEAEGSKIFQSKRPRRNRFTI